MSLVAVRHVGSSRTRDRTRVPCIGRRILNHCATGEAHPYELLVKVLQIDRINRIYMAKPIPLHMEAGKFQICSEQTGDLGELMVYF